MLMYWQDIPGAGPSMEHFGVTKSDLMFDDVIMAEYIIFMEIR